MTGQAMLHGEGTIAVEVQWDGVSWTDVTADVMYDAKVNITQGRSDETSQAQPAGLTFALLNTAGNYTPYTPASIYYPNVRRNIAVRVRFDPGGGFKQIYFGYAVGFTPAWDTSAKKATVNVVVAGTLRRLTQGKTPLRSALYRQTVQYPSLLAFWPLDDGATTTVPAQAVAGGPILTVHQPVRGVSPLPALPVVFGAAGPSGGAAGVDLSNGGFLKANVSTGAKWSVGFAVQIVDGIGQVAPVPAGSGLGVGGANIEVFRVNCLGGGSFWFSYFNDGLNDGFSFLQLGYDNSNGSLALASGSISDAVNDGQWHYVTMTAERFTNGLGTFDAYATQVDDEAVVEGFLLPGDSIQPVQSVSSGETFEFGDATDRKFMLSNMFVATGCDHFDDGLTYAGPLPFNQAANISSFFGWVGETVDARLTRLFGEQGETISITGTSNMTMGVQPVAALIDLARECEATDGGVLFDGFDVGIGYICRSSRYNLSAAITADMSAGQVAAAFAPVDDDQRNRNDVTTNRSAGSSARAVDATGPLGTGMIGVYDTSLTVNTDTDDPLLHIAEWNVALGTVEGLRYPTLPFDLVASTALISSWLNVGTISFRADVTNVTSKATQHPPGTVSVIVEGYSMVLDLASWTITANCSPFAPWRVFKVQDSVLGRVDTGGSTLLAPVSSGTTTLPVVSASPWTTAGGDMPFDVGLGGEQCTVTAVAASGTALSRVGAFLSTSSLGASDFNGALANFVSITGITPPVIRWYQAQGDFSIGSTSLAQMVTAGKKICLTLRPDFNPVSSAHLASLDTMLSTLKGSGAVVNVTLWHEPFFSGLTAAQFVNVVRYYGPTVRKYYPLWFVCSGADADIGNGFYPGDAYVDGIGVDAYALSGTTQITNAQSIADNGGKPFAVWEFNGGADLGQATAVQGQTQATVTAHFQYLSDLFTSRLAAGKPNGDVLFFSSGGSNGSTNFLTTSLSANGGFETGLGNWASGSATILQTAVQAHSGTKSAQMTSAGGTANIVMCTTPNVTTQGLPCNPGDIVAGMGWFRSQVTARSCRVDIHFYTSGGVSISTITGGTVADTTTGWVSALTSGVAPATTAFARLEPSVQATAAAEVHYFDDPEIAVLPATNDLTSPIQYPWDYRIAALSAMVTALDGTSFPQNMTVTRAVNGVAKAHSIGDAVKLWHPGVLAL